MAGNADVQVGDRLETSGLDGVYPPGLPVAQVARIDRRADSAFARIVLTPLANPESSRHVLLLKTTGHGLEDPTQVGGATGSLAIATDAPSGASAANVAAASAAAAAARAHARVAAHAASHPASIAAPAASAVAARGASSPASTSKPGGRP